MPRILTWKVTGMTCHSCEKIIQDVLKDIPGVLEVEVSLKQSRAGVQMHDNVKNPDLELLNKGLGAHGYTLIPDEKSGRNAAAACDIPSVDQFSVRLGRAAAVLAIVGLASFAVLGPLRAILPNVSATASVGAMLIFGLVASVSTCLATTGGFLLAYNGKPRTNQQLLAVHGGRLAAFVVGGALLGLIGRSIPGVSESLYGVLALGLGILFLVMGLHMLELSPSLAKLGLTLPGGMSKLGERISSSNGRAAPFLVGAVTFILPCGFTQTAQALALASGSPLIGMLLMGTFVIGTLPVLAGLSAFGTVKALKYRAVRLATGAVLSLFAFGQIDGGLTVLGSPVTPGSILAGWTSRAAETAVPAANAQEQIVQMAVAYGAYQPSHLTVKKGIPVRWEINGDLAEGCTSSFVVPRLGIRKTLSRGINIIQFTPAETGTIPFSCAMGMARGSFTVTN